MLYLHKKNIYPIITPEKYFIDRFNNPNSYFEMNPSINIDKNGNVKILVRLVNYKKFSNRTFTVYENYSSSKYVLLKGKINETQLLNIDDFECEDITYNYLLPTYPTYWKGLEDIRFMDSNTLLITIPECNPSGNPSIFKATLENNIIHSFITCKPQIIEKNWMPFTDENYNNYVIYSLNPFKIKNIEDETFKELSFSEEITKQLENFHGSTNGITYKSEILFLIHINGDKTQHKWLLFNYKTNEIQISNEFVFFKYSYIEFTTSLTYFNERIFISLGVNDDKSFIIEINEQSINDCFISQKHSISSLSNENNWTVIYK
jgi:hypothetical protein